MIEFQHKLPSLNIDGRHNGTYNNKEMVLPCVLTTTDYRLGEFLHQLHNIIHDDRSLVFIDGKVLMCSKNWIRDHVHEMKGFKHWDYDLKSFLQFIIDTQREDGQYYELIKQLDDEHWKYVNEDCSIIYPDDNVALVRLEIEADIEYLVVEGAMNYYRATGDFDWLKSVLPKLEKGIEYCTSNPKRFCKKYGLAIRAYTIDTWDFTYDISSQTDRRIHDDQQMCAMHGDNSGIYAAMNNLAWIRNKCGDVDKAIYWTNKANELKANMFKYLWNGKFFIHQLPITGSAFDEHESERLSLSNTYDMNRGVTNLEESSSIIQEYIDRKEKTEYIAEWFTIDPPYEKFMLYSKGRYVNGAISPFAAGELSLASFKNGYEDYGWSIISRFIEYLERDGKIFFLYSPIDGAAQDKQGPSAWGAAALLNAVDEGLAGVRDIDSLYKEIEFSPRFVVTPYDELRYITGYEISGCFVDVRFILTDVGMCYEIHSNSKLIHTHALLPKNKKCTQVIVNGQIVEYTITKVHNSTYVSFDVVGEPIVKMEFLF